MDNNVHMWVEKLDERSPRGERTPSGFLGFPVKCGSRVPVHLGSYSVYMCTCTGCILMNLVESHDDEQA